MYTKRALQNVAILEEAILPQEAPVANSSSATSQATSASGSFTGSEHMQVKMTSSSHAGDLAVLMSHASWVGIVTLMLQLQTDASCL